MLLKKEWQLPESTAQQCCDVFLRQFRHCPDHSDFDLDDWRSLLWASALDIDYQHLAGTTNNVIIRFVIIYFIINYFISLLQVAFSPFGKSCVTPT